MQRSKLCSQKQAAFAKLVAVKSQQRDAGLGKLREVIGKDFACATSRTDLEAPASKRKRSVCPFRCSSLSKSSISEAELRDFFKAGFFVRIL